MLLSPLLFAPAVPHVYIFHDVLIKPPSFPCFPISSLGETTSHNAPLLVSVGEKVPFSAISRSVSSLSAAKQSIREFAGNFDPSDV